MMWLIFSLLTAFFESMKNVASKKSLMHIDEYIVSWFLRFFSMAFIIPLVFLIGIPALQHQFWLALLFGGSVNILITVFFMKSIKDSDLSLTVPIFSFTPLFLLLTSPVMVGEFPNSLGLAGVLLIVTGSYILNLERRRGGLTRPLRTMLKESGPKYMLFVAFLGSIGSNIDKIGVQSSSPVFWAFAVNLFVTLAMLPMMASRSRKDIAPLPKKATQLLLFGLFSALTLVFQMTAINLALVAYVISIKRTSGVISVLFGYIFFREKNIRKRLAGAMIMVVGVLFITFG